MAQLPPDGEWLIQQMGGVVILFHRHTEQEIVRFDPGDANGIGPVLYTIWQSKLLTDEQKTFACFWAGYFYAHATLGMIDG